MLKYEELKAKDLIKQAFTLEPSQTLYDARNILLRYNISRVVILVLATNEAQTQ